MSNVAAARTVAGRGWALWYARSMYYSGWGYLDGIVEALDRDTPRFMLRAVGGWPENGRGPESMFAEPVVIPCSIPDTGACRRRVRKIVGQRVLVHGLIWLDDGVPQAVTRLKDLIPADA